MPSATILSEKQKYVADLAEQLKSAVAGVIVDYRGINVADDTALRKELREAGVKYTVVKKHHAAAGCSGSWSGHRKRAGRHYCSGHQ